MATTKKKKKYPRQVCDTCGRSLAGDEFMTGRDRQKITTCTTCLTANVDNTRPETFLPILERLDVPYVQDLWIDQAKRQYCKNPEGFGPRSVLGLYVRTMKMAQYRNFGYADSDKANEMLKSKRISKATLVEAKEKAAEEKPSLPTDYLKEVASKEVPQESETVSKYRRVAAKNEDSAKVTIGGVTAPQIDLMGEIEMDLNAESMLDPSQRTLTNTIMETARAAKHSRPSGSKPSVAEKIVKSNPFAASPEAQMDREKSILIDLTREDVKMLTLKWGDTYRPSEWVKMEETYRKYADEYEMNVDRENTLRQICKISLKLDQAIDEGNFADAQKLQSMLDQLRKSGKFTEAQNKEDKEKYVDSIGQLVGEVERIGGIIPPYRYDDGTPPDKVDLTLRDNQAYLYNLVKNEMGLGDLIESYIQKLEAADEQAKRSAAGEDLVTTVSDEELAAREAENWEKNLQASIAADADALFARIGEQDVTQ